MVDGQHKLSRRALLGASLVPLILSGAERSRSAWSKDASPLVRHPGLDPGSTFASPGSEGRRWIPDQVRDDENCAVTIWNQALARLREDQAVLDAAVSEPDQDRYDALLDSHSDALTALLALPAPDLPALAAKLDAIVPNQAWELTGSEDCLELLRHDARRLAATAA